MYQMPVVSHSQLSRFTSDAFCRCNSMTAFTCGITINTLLFYLILFRTTASTRPYSRSLMICCISDMICLVLQLICGVRVKYGDGVLLLALCGPASILRFPNHTAYESNLRWAVLYFGTLLFAVMILPIQFYCRYRLTIKKDVMPQRGALTLMAIVLNGAFLHCIVGASALELVDSERSSFDFARLWFDESPIPLLLVGNYHSYKMLTYHSYSIFCLSLSALCVYMLAKRTFRTMKGRISPKTLSLRLNFGRALVIHSSVVYLIYSVAYFLAIPTLCLGAELGEGQAVAIFMLSWIPVWNPICTIFFVIPYRRALWNIVSRQPHASSVGTLSRCNSDVDRRVLARSSRRVRRHVTII